MNINVLAILLAICAFVLIGCNQKDTSYVQGNLAIITVRLSIDSEGKPSISYGIQRNIGVKLGFIGLSAGIERTMEFSNDKPRYLFIVWEDSSGEVYRDEYEIGRPFEVSFSQSERVEKIQGRSEGTIIVAVKRTELPPTSFVPSPRLPPTIAPFASSLTPTSTSIPRMKYSVERIGCNGGFGSENYKNKFSIEGRVWRESSMLGGVRLAASKRQDDLSSARQTITGLNTKVYSFDLFYEAGIWYFWIIDTSGERISEIGSATLGQACPHAEYDFHQVR